MNSDVFMNFLRNISLEEIIQGENCNAPLTTKQITSTSDRFAHVIFF